MEYNGTPQLFKEDRIPFPQCLGLLILGKKPMQPKRKGKSKWIQRKNKSSLSGLREQRQAVVMEMMKTTKRKRNRQC
jgi:hypothetical protein